MSEAALVAKILEWLGKHGYQVELRAGLAFRSAGWTVAHSRYYTDLETGKPREIDIVASIVTPTYNASGPTPWCQFEFVVECKGSRGKPWVVFAGPAPKIVLASDVVLGRLGIIALEQIDMRLVREAEFLQPGRIIGHGIARAFADQGDSEGGSQPWNAVRGAAAAAAALAEKLEQDRKTISSTFSFIPIVVPLVVVDAPLFRYTLSADGAEELAAIQWIRVPAPITGRSDSIYVGVVTLESLGAFLDDITEEAKALADAVVARSTDILRFHELREGSQPRVRGLTS